MSPDGGRRRDRSRRGAPRPAVPDVVPVLPLRDAVAFPFIILPLSITREASALAVERALAADRSLLLVAQKDDTVDEPGADDLHPVGTVGTVMRMLKLPDGRTRILVQGLARVRLAHLARTEPFLQARVETLEEASSPASDDPVEIEAATRGVREALERVANLGQSVSPDVVVLASNLNSPGRLADLAASNLELSVAAAQELLELLDPVERLHRVHELLVRESEVLGVQHEMSNRARDEMDRGQREYFLRQQLKAIQQELGEVEELSAEVETYRERARTLELEGEVLEEVERQIRRLERSHPDSAEGAVVRSWLEWATTLPWNVESEDDLDLDHARRVLDEDHWDLEKVKQRILEFLAVRRLKGDSRGPILCFVGPPGVGKTSLGRSIARALGRRLVRIALGGVRDEAEIRGHRRTYVGALPGRVVQGLAQAGTANPVFMLDEIDKVGADRRGDPSSALLEVLDPEQNATFRDHYLGLPWDLSRVLFITTANLLEPIQPAFRDRMEVLRLPGYTEEDKLEIARRHLVPKQLEENGLGPDHVELTDDALVAIIRGYTKEAGVRSLEREIGSVFRKVALEVARRLDSEDRTDGDGDDDDGETDAGETGAGEPGGRTDADERPPRRIDAAAVADLLGPARHFSEELLDRDQVGVATGLAWTAAGGDLLFIEVVAVAGGGELRLTGQLGEVMKESAQAALSLARAWLDRASRARNDEGPEKAAPAPIVAADFFAHHDLHVHVPAGSIPKDGPSAGVTIATALLSVLTGRPVDRRLAMTGEITLRGDVLPIGGVKEKLLAARGAGVRRIVMPRLNRRDVEEIPEPQRAGLEVHLVDHVDEVLALALTAPTDDPPEPEREESDP